MSSAIYSPKNTIIQIDHVWMAISVDPKDKTEAVCAVMVGDMWMPLIAADEARLPWIRAQAIKLGKQSNMIVKIIRLSTREVLEEL